MKKLFLEKTILLLVLCVIIFNGCTNSNKFSVSGKIVGAEGKVLHFNRLSIDGVEAVDSVKLSSSGAYSFDGAKLAEPTFFTLTIDKKNITLLNDSNINMGVVANFQSFDDDYKITNSPESELIQNLNAKLKKTLAEIEVIKIKFSKATSDAERNSLIVDINRVINQHKQFIGTFVASHPRSFASYYAIYQKFDEANFILNVLDKKDLVYYSTIATSLNIYYPKSERVKVLYSYVLNAMQQLNNAKLNEFIKTLPSIGFPELNIADKDGRKIALSSFKGKVILLSFWASWSREGMAFNKELKRVYKKFGGKGFEIYQVSLDQNKLYWEVAMLRDELSWTNVCEFTFPNSYSAILYNVQKLPANFLINKQGDVIGRNLEGAMLDEKIASNL